MSPGSVGPVSHETTQQSFDSLVQKLGVADAPDAAKLAALRSVPANQLQELAANRTEIILSEDPEFFEDYSGETFEHLSVIPPWLERVVVGDLKEENAPLSQFWSKVPPQTLIDTWMKLYGDDSAYAKQVLEVYGLGALTVRVLGTILSKRSLHIRATYSSPRPLPPLLSRTCHTLARVIIISQRSTSIVLTSPISSRRVRHTATGSITLWTMRSCSASPEYPGPTLHKNSESHAMSSLKLRCI